MGCFGDGENLESVSAEQKWNYINLSDFSSTSCLTPLSYGILYISLVISVVCYGVDLFTAINLLAFDRWSGQVQPVIPFTISRWIFASCTILSWILLAYRWWRAIRAMHSGGIARSYLDPLAVRIQSARMGSNGRGWRRFLVFAELTKSKKGSEYLALFTYFSFEAWMRIIFAEGPRNAINAMTLYSVMQLNLIPNGKHAASDGHTPIVQFFYNVQILANSNRERAAILFGMLFTLIIWAISALSLAAACLIYITFLWHHIPSTDCGLSGFCKRKIDSRLQKIVGVKIKKALEKGEMNTSKEDLKSGVRPGQLKRQPTIPLLTTENDDKLPEMPILSRQTTQATLPPYTARPTPGNDDVPSGIYRQPTLPNVAVGPSRPPPSRSNTQFSSFSSRSYNSDAPLIGGAMAMGYVPRGQPHSATQPSRMASDRSIMGTRPSVGRMTTNMSQRSQRSYYSSSRPLPSAPPTRQNTEFSDCQSHANFTSNLPTRQNTSTSIYSMNARPTPGCSPIDTQSRRTPTNPISPLHSYPSAPQTGRHTLIEEYEMRSQPSLSNMHRSPSGNRYIAYNPNKTPLPIDAPPMPTSTSIPSHRNFTTPNRQPQNDYFPPQPRPPQRSGTAPLPQTATYDDSIYDSYGGREGHVIPRPAMPSRAATASPGGGVWRGNGNRQRQYRPCAY